MIIKSLIRKYVLRRSCGKRNLTMVGLGIIFNLFSMQGVSAHDVTVNVTGTITNTTCSISSDSINKQVTLDTFVTGYTHVGDSSSAKSFTINLENCGVLENGVEVTFSGTPDTLFPDYFKLDPESTASGFAVKLTDENQTVIPVGSTTTSYYIADNAATKALLFNAQIVQTDSTTVNGTVYATATFKMVYP